MLASEPRRSSLPVRIPLNRLPVPGDSVGPYLVLEQVGQGGQGHVYKAQCAGRWFALKFFQVRPAAPWGEHELDVLRRLEHPNVVRILGYGRWPDPERGFLYLVMEWVDGLTLEDHAQVHGLPARRAATHTLKVARALGAVHAAGVRHRDVKPDNILMRGLDEEPILVDFGVAHLEGLSSVEGRGQMVGTREFFSPEACDFIWEHYGDGVLYRADVSDEVWALGVSLYWMLTGALPFGSRFTNPNMIRDIRDGMTVAPHERNGQVPAALSGVCMRLLEKEPGARFADMEAVGTALEAVLAGAEGDSRWDVPLVKTAPRPLPEPPSPPAVPMPPPSPMAKRNVWRRALSHLLPTGVGVLPVRTLALEALRRAVPVLVLMLLATVGTWLLAARLHAPESAPPSRSVAGNPTPDAGVFQAVAAGGKSAESSGAGAAPSLSSLPASESAHTMNPKQQSQLKPDAPSSLRPQRKTRRCVPDLKEVCLAGVCTVMLTGCPGAPARQVVRPTPGLEECPPGSVQTMRETLGISIGDGVVAQFPESSIEEPVTVREGPTQVEMRQPLGKLPVGTILTGRLLFGEKRLYGRLTQAHRADGKTFPVCIEFYQEGNPGMKLISGAGTDTFKVGYRPTVRSFIEFGVRQDD